MSTSALIWAEAADGGNPRSNINIVSMPNSSSRLRLATRNVGRCRRQLSPRGIVPAPSRPRLPRCLPGSAGDRGIYDFFCEGGQREPARLPLSRSGSHSCGRVSFPPVGILGPTLQRRAAADAGAAASAASRAEGRAAAAERELGATQNKVPKAPSASLPAATRPPL